jgi:hypothetical protein
LFTLRSNAVTPLRSVPFIMKCDSCHPIYFCIENCLLSMYDIIVSTSAAFQTEASRSKSRFVHSSFLFLSTATINHRSESTDAVPELRNWIVARAIPVAVIDPNLVIRLPSAVFRHHSELSGFRGRFCGCPKLRPRLGTRLIASCGSVSGLPPPVDAITIAACAKR